MSQEKVTKYKEAKANRKETIKKEKRVKLIRNTVAGIVVAAVVGWVGYSAVAFYIANLPRPEAEVNYTAISDYETRFYETSTENQ